MGSTTTAERPTVLQIAAAYAAIYFIWGGTYLAIRYAVEVLPPFLMMGARHLIAGTLLYTAVRWRGTPRPERIHWLGAMVAGGFLFLGDHGLLAWGEQRVPSGLAALLSATLPFWMVAGVRVKGIEPKLNLRAWGGLAIGLAGVAFLVGPDAFGLTSWGYIAGTGAILLGAIFWVVGSLYARGAKLPKSPLLSAAMQMVSGGAFLLVAGGLTGELGRLHMEGVTPRAVLSLAYLILFGSIVAFGSYVWLLRVSAPSRVSTYAYVNPLVAVFLGWSMAGEAVTWRTILAAGLILIGVALVNTRGVAEARAKREVAVGKEKVRIRMDTAESRAAQGVGGVHERSPMIARLWRGITRAEDADRYYQYLVETGLKEYRSIPGNRGVYTLRKVGPQLAEFLLISLWDSFDAIEKFAGPQYEKAVYYPKDAKFLLEMEPNVTHYEVLPTEPI